MTPQVGHKYIARVDGDDTSWEDVITVTGQVGKGLFEGQWYGETEDGMPGIWTTDEIISEVLDGE